MSTRPEPRSQAMPMERAILWNPSLPGARQSGRAPYPIFFQQEAVIALQEHLKGSPTQAIFGFLIGDVYRDPETGVLYTVIDKTLKLSQAIYGDKTEVVVARLWDRMQEQLAKAAGSLLGWYHSHPGQGGYLTTHDVETHEKYFTDPWHVAILVAAEAGGVTGRFFRASQNADWHKTPLPFYELLQPDSIKPDGKKRSYITWRNYKAFEAVVAAKPGSTPPKAAPLPPPPPPPPPVEEEEVEEEVEEVEAVEEEEVEAAREPKRTHETKPADGGFRIMRSSADDMPVIRTSADDEAAPPPKPEPPPPPSPPRQARKSAPVFIPDEEPPPPRSSTDLPWAVTPESVASVPPPPFEPPAPASREPRRTPTHAFKLLDQREEEERKPAPRARRRRRRGPWLRRLMILVLLAGVGAGAYWYFALRNPGVPPPWSGLLERAKKLVSRATTRTPPPPRPPAQRPAPPPPPVASPFARYDRLSDSLLQAVRSFQDRAALFASGGANCGGLASGLASVESLWITYNTERRARMSTFDLRRATQDQALYAAVDSVESRFERSGCPRP